MPTTADGTSHPARDGGRPLPQRGRRVPGREQHRDQRGADRQRDELGGGRWLLRISEPVRHNENPLQQGEHRFGSPRSVQHPHLRLPRELGMPWLLVLAAVMTLLTACQQPPASHPSVSKAASPAEQLKSEGDAFMAKADYESAIEKYRQAADLDPTAIAPPFGLRAPNSLLRQHPH